MKKSTPAKTTTPAKNTTPPKNVKKTTPGGDRQDQQDDKKAKQKADQERLDREAKAAADEIARLKREAARKKAEADAEKERQAQIDKKNQEKPVCKLPVVGEKKCLPVEEEKDEQVEVSSGTVSGRMKNKEKEVESTEKVTYGQSGISKSKKNSKQKKSSNLKFKNLSVSDVERLKKTFDDIYGVNETSQEKVGNQTGLKNTGEKLLTDGSANRQANNASNSNQAR